LTPFTPDDKIILLFKSFMRKLILAISSGLGTGYFPVAPGTAGSLLGLAIAVPFMLKGGDIGGPVYVILSAAIFFAGVWAAGEAEKIHGEQDCGKIVVDEVAGMLVTLYLLPATWLYLIVGFFAFRFFDIVKPFPARTIDQRMHGGFGVMLDDIVAGIYANLSLHLLKLVVS
jgi:phosphatidylglycerophosphatase A